MKKSNIFQFMFTFFLDTFIKEALSFGAVDYSQCISAKGVIPQKMFRIKHQTASNRETAVLKILEIDITPKSILMQRGIAC